MAHAHPPIYDEHHQRRLLRWREAMQRRGVNVEQLGLSHEEMHMWAEAWEEEERAHSR